MRLGDGMITAEFPPLRQPKPEIADRGTVRLGDGMHHGRLPAIAAAQARDRRSRHGAARRRLITAGFPPLRQPKPETVDRGTVRLGDG